MWLAEFATPEELARAVREARAAGYSELDTLSPFPVAEAERELVSGERGMLAAGLLGGLGFAVLIYVLQVYTSAIDYPIDVGGRPMHSWPSFLPASIAVGLLGAALGVVARMLMRCRLPRLHHPLFEVPAFARASTDRFFLVVPGEADENLLARLEPLAVHRVEGEP